MAKKKIAEFEIESKVPLIDRELNELTVSKQCELLAIPRSTYYYKPCRDNSFRLQVMRAIDEIYTKHPYYGTRRMVVALERMGISVGRDLVRSLMQQMGIQAIYPKPNLSKPHPEHKVYPYLLRGVNIVRKNQVWSTDITYIRMATGFLYLTAVIDWQTRFILAWRLSNSLDGASCRDALLEALKRGKPEIFNTDQGAQFTSPKFTNILKEKGIQISMDGRGRALDNVFVERFWRTIKQEEVYLKDYQSGLEAHKNLDRYISYYNHERPHSALEYQCPANAYNLICKT